MSYSGLKEREKGKGDIRQTERIIEALFNDPTISDEDREIMLQWLASGENQNIKTKILKQKFNEEFRYESDPVYALEMWPELSKRLNLSVDVDKVLRRMKKSADEKNETKRSFHTRTIFKIAAVIFPVFVIGTALYLTSKYRTERLNTDLQAETMTVCVPDDGLKTVVLPDGSKVWLKDGSTIEYSKDFQTNRLIKLDGEAYFYVIASGGAVFTVETDRITATVLGTKFNIKAYTDEDEAQITLDEGLVEVSAAQEKIMMEPQDRITLNKETNLLKVERGVGVQEGWRSGVEFYDNTLKEMLTAIAIHFNMELEIKGDLPEYGIRFGFDYDESPDTILLILKNAYGSFSYEITGDKISITAN